MKTFLLSIITAVFLGNLVVAQECGTEPTEDDFRLIEELRRGGFIKDLGSGLIPVVYHVIAADDSSHGMDTASIYNEMNLVNERFSAVGMEFYECHEVDFIYDSNYIDFEKYVSEDICDAHDIPNVLNIWFADNVFKMDGNDIISICGYAYLSGPNDRIIIDNDCGDNSSTLAHEIGHYFSLLHTHNGGGELADGSNCQYEGDMLCDTPADPRLSSSNVSSSCVYIGTETDANGDDYNPLPDNIMSYSRKHCRTEFSTEQFDQMVNYLGTYRNYLSCTVTDVGLDRQEHHGVKIYPNPTSERFAISFYHQDESVEAEVFLYDAFGKSLYSRNYRLNQGANKIEVKTKHGFSGGIYYVLVRTKDFSSYQRLVVN